MSRKKPARRKRGAILLSLLAAAPLPIDTAAALAQLADAATTPATPFDQRASELIAVLTDRKPLESFFDPTFLAQIPPEQIKALSANFVKQYGAPSKIVGVSRKNDTTGTVKVAFEKAVISIDMAVSGAAPHYVIGMFFGDIDVANDSLAAVAAEMAALPGRTGYQVESIAADGTRTEIAGRNVADQFAIGSTFKLYILAELAAQIEAGKRKWSDVIPLKRRSYSSMGSEGIPLDTPVTLQLLASWMIIVSDNAATDELLLLLGRDRVEARVKAIGHSDISRMLPFLTTVEAGLIKSNYDNVLAAYIKGSDAEQRALLARSISSIDVEKMDYSKLGSKPAAIDTVEWFASADDIVRLMDHIRSRKDPVMRKIMAQSIAPGTAKKWKYLGYKGGSEPGVISMSYLGQKQSGDWIVITGSWNNVDAAVDDGKFAALMQRLLDLHAG